MIRSAKSTGDHRSNSSGHVFYQFDGRFAKTAKSYGRLVRIASTIYKTGSPARRSRRGPMRCSRRPALIAERGTGHTRIGGGGELGVM
jgi:hypothetical protein